ncbi:MAG: protein kinase [Deltaproteobacteria bacterium]|nr:protein kinase [Deltaproteobacteria bacterium]
MHEVIIGRIVLGRYRVVRALAKGGMGVVYLGRSEGASGFTKPVVIKRMASDLMMDQGMARMFVREARLMSRLRHPSLVGVIDFGEEQGDYLMVIEYVHGYHLGQWHRFRKKVHGPFPADLIIHIIIKVLDALHYAHNLKDDDGDPLKIIHRDVSPANILIDIGGQVKLADFGIARSKDQTEQTEATTIKGKMPYLAPELFRLDEASPSSDSYSCGVVLRELLVGRNDFRARDLASTVSRVLQYTPDPIEGIRDDLPPGLGPVLRKALAKTAAKRYQSAADFADALREVRPGTDEEMQKRLLQCIEEDFRDPRMSEIVRGASLAEREEAWRNPPIYQSLRPSGPAGDLPISVAPARVRGKATKSSAPSRSQLPWVVGGVVAVAAIVAVALVFLKEGGPTRPERPTFIQVQAGQAPDGASDGPRTVEDSGPEDADVGVDEPRDATPASSDQPNGRMVRGAMMRRRTGPNANELARAFHAQRSRVTACYRDHAADAPPSGQAEIVISVDPLGLVVSARVTPAGVGASPLGACVVRIARTVEFPGQGQPVRFRIPLRFTH